MRLAKWMQANDIALKTLSKALGDGGSIFAIRKWLRGERTPRPEMQSQIKKVTGGAVTGDDWLPK